MKRIFAILLLSWCACALGALFFAWHQKYILIIVPSREFNASHEQVASKKQQVTMWYYKEHRMAHETIDMVWPHDTVAQVTTLVTTWLTLLHEHEIVTKKIACEAVASTESGMELIISCDRNLFEKQMSTETKLMIVESLLKTLREQDIKVQQIRFLVNHKPMLDTHLDFSHPWPLSGYVEQ
jgi:hypothetical protein